MSNDRLPEVIVKVNKVLLYGIGEVVEGRNVETFRRRHVQRPAEPIKVLTKRIMNGQKGSNPLLVPERMV